MDREKVVAAGMFVNIFQKMSFVDYRIVKRFRIWQLEYLTPILKGVYDKHRYTHRKYSRSLFILLNEMYLRKVRRCFGTWKAKARKEVSGK